MDANWTSASEGLLNQMFPVHRACRDGDIEKLASLLLTGDVDLYEEDDFYGWTPIHWSAYFGKLQCLMYILEHGGNCDAATERLNQAPSHIAAYGGHCHCLKWLLHCGAAMNRQLACLRRLINALESTGVNGCDLATSKFSQTAVHLCAFGGHPQSLYWLAQSKCDLNAKDYMGETPVHKAARTGSMECVSLLVSQGANLSIKNYSGNTASQVAMTAGYADCGNHLERAAEIQRQTMGIPAITEATNNGNSSVSNGRTSPEGQPSVPNHFISTNTYHSHPHMSMNGTSHPPQMQTGLNNNNHDDCDMEMEDGSHDISSNQSSCTNGFHQEVSNGDILLNQGVSKNIIPLAGKKRGREDTEEEAFKRARQDDSAATKCKLNGWFVNNGHMVSQLTDHMGDHVTNHVRSQATPVSESMVEHYTSVSMQQGYDSMMFTSMVPEQHNS